MGSLGFLEYLTLNAVFHSAVALGMLRIGTCRETETDTEPDRDRDRDRDRDSERDMDIERKRQRLVTLCSRLGDVEDRVRTRTYPHGVCRQSAICLSVCLSPSPSCLFFCPCPCHLACPRSVPAPVSLTLTPPLPLLLALCGHAKPCQQLSSFLPSLCHEHAQASRTHRAARHRRVDCPSVRRPVGHGRVQVALVGESLQQPRARVRQSSAMTWYIK